jgi:drug/metabolite transporter (DMT)-like permease
VSTHSVVPGPGPTVVPSRTVRGIILMIAGVSLIATMDLLVKFASPGLGVAQIAWGRYAVQLFVLLVIALPAGPLGFLRARLRRLHVLRALVLLGGNVAFIAALRHMPLVQANLIGFLSPLLLTALAYPVLGETVGPRRALVVAAGFAGVLLVLRPGGAIFGWEALLPLTMAVCAASYHVMTPLVRRVEDPAISLYYMSFLAVLVTTAMMPWAWSPMSGRQWALLAGIGLLSVSGHVLMIRALEAAPASTLAPFFYCHLLWALFYDGVFFGVLPDGLTLAGAALVVGSGVYVYRAR